MGRLLSLARSRLITNYWALPALLTMGAIGCALLLLEIDRLYPGTAGWLGWGYGGGADGARAVLSAVAGSMVTVVSVTFSVMVLALTVSSQHFGPRLLNSFMRDRPAQVVLGTFTGTFAYCLMVLRTVQGDGGDRYSVFVPHLAVTAAVLLTLVSVGALIYYVHHVSTSMQVSEITAAVARDFERSIERLYPEDIGQAELPPWEPPPPRPAEAVAVPSRESGYIESIDSDAVLQLAERHAVSLWLLHQPGDFAVEGAPLAAVFPAPPDLDTFAAALRRTFVIANDRSSHQDAAFAVQQLVEVALRALSAGVNEPFTAITAIDRLAQGLTRLAGRRTPAAVRTSADGRGSVITSPTTFEQLLKGGFEPIAIHAGKNPAIGERLLEMLAVIGAATKRQPERAVVAGVARFVTAVTTVQLDDEGHRQRLLERLDRVVDTLQQPG